MNNGKIQLVAVILAALSSLLGSSSSACDQLPEAPTYERCCLGNQVPHRCGRFRGQGDGKTVEE